MTDRCDQALHYLKAGIGGWIEFLGMKIMCPADFTDVGFFRDLERIGLIEHLYRT